jgi:cell division protein ZapA
MSVETIDVELTICDKSYRIHAPVTEQETLKQAAKYLDEQMKEIRRAAKNMENERVAVMAALNICHELFQKNKQADDNKRHIEDSKKISQALQILTGKIDKALAS